MMSEGTRVVARALASIGVLACAGNPTAPSVRSPKEPPVLRLHRAGLGRGEQNRTLADQVRTFAPDEPIVLVTEVERASPGLTLRVRWSRGADQVQEDVAPLTGGTQVLAFPFKASQPRPRGWYRVSLSVDEEPVGALTFEVHDAPVVEEPVIFFGEGDTPARALTEGPVHPPYPQEWVEKGPDGLVIVRCLVTTKGTAEDCLIMYPVWFTGESTLRWLEGQRWTPVTRGGQSANAWYVFNFSFRHRR